MQLSGELGDDIKIVGALSDNSIPIQPEGNSQQLQEFDKIYIVLSRKNSSLTVGDFELNRPPATSSIISKNSRECRLPPRPLSRATS